MRTIRALKRLGQAVVRDPVRALVVTLTSPIRLFRYLLGAILILALEGVAGWVLWFVVYKLAGLWHNAAANMVAVGVIGLVMLVTAWRFLTAPLLIHFGNDGSDTHGSARFATARETAALRASTDGLLIGRDPRNGALLRYDGPAHLLTFAPTRSGKGVGTVIPNLLLAQRSVVCIDPKGETAKIAARARSHVGPVFVLDPFGITGQIASAYNPLSGMDASNLDVADDINALADALVYDPPTSRADPHWNEEAKALLSGLLLNIVQTEPPARRHLATLRDYLTQPPAGFDALLERMQQAGGLVARAANRHLGKADREASGVLSAAQRHTHFLDSPRMVASLARSDFDFARLKAQDATVFVVLPPDRLEAYARWQRLIIGQALQAMSQSPAPSGRPPVLFMLDECAALGHLAPLERAMGLMAGYGVQLWPIWQDVHQLRAIYDKHAGTFMSNAAVLQVFGVTDQESARMVSDMLGQETVVFQTMGRALDSRESGLSLHTHHHGRPLLTPDEVRTLPESKALLFLAGQRPVVADKVLYYRDGEFQGKFDSL